MVVSLEPGGAARCLQVALDYHAPNEHYDVRIVRNCDPGSTRKTPVDYFEPNSCGIPCNLHLNQIQVAYYHPATNTLTNKTCQTYETNRSCADWDPGTSGNPLTARIWGRRADGTNWYQGAGFPQQSDGKKPRD
jgi:hypothetical protein